MAFAYNVSAATAKQLVAAIGLGVKAEHAYVTAADSLYADGVRPATMADKAWRTEFVADIIRQTFSATDWGIFAKPIRSLSEAEKVTHRHVKSQVDRRYATVLKYVKRAEAEETMDDETRAARQTTTFEARQRKILEAMIKKVQNREELYFDGTRFVSHLKAALEVLNKG